MTRSRVAFLLWLSLAVVSGVACDRPAFTLGGGCELNTDCADPLVCVIGYCRRPCVDSRDCGAGLLCLGTAAGGGCQLDTEAMCERTSQCTLGLVCQNETCTTMCGANRDCAPGATCRTDLMPPACEEADRCLFDSQCDPPLICDRDQVCRLECVLDRDCPYPRVCRASLCELPDASMPMDGGL